MKKLSALTAAVIACGILLASCTQATTETATTETSGVRGDLSGVVVNSSTGNAISGVTVSVAGKAATTDSSGVYIIEDLIPGSYTVSFTLAGYATETAAATVNAAQYKEDDPYAEYEIALAELALFSKYLDSLGSIALGDGWTYSAGTFTSSDGTISVTYDSTTQSFAISNSSVGKSGYTYAISMGVQELDPLSGTISGAVNVAFSTTKGATNTNDSYSTAAAADGVQVWALDLSAWIGEAADNATFLEIVQSLVDGTDLTSEQIAKLADLLPLLNVEVYGPVTTTSGTYTLTGLPASHAMAIFANPFSQASASNLTYYFAGNYIDAVLDLVDSSGLTEAQSAALSLVNDDSILLGLTVALDGVSVQSAPKTIYASSDKAVLTAHSIGDANVNARIAVDGSFTLTFNKSIAASSFSAYLDVDNDGVFEDDGDSAYDSGEDVALVATWDTAGTTATLSPKTRFPYGTDSAPSGYLVIAGGSATDGAAIAYASAATADRLAVYTEKSLALTGYEFLDSASAAKTINYESYKVLPYGGSIALTFDKALSSDTTKQSFKLYDANLTLISDDLDFTIVNTGSVGVATVAFGSELPFSSVYRLVYSVASTRPDDVCAISTDDPIAFRSSDGIELKSVNLYRNSSTAYYTEAPSETASYFGLSSTIVLTFSSAIPTGASVTGELYKASDISGLMDDATALAKKLRATTSSLSTDRTVLSLDPSATLEPGTKYALAVKIVSSAGLVMFNTKSEAFYYFNATSSAYALSSDIVAMSHTIDATSGGSPYIAFTTEAELSLLNESSTAYPAIATNLGTTGTITSPVTTDFDATGNIVLEFSTALATPGADDVELYFYHSDGDATLEESDFVEAPATSSLNSAGTILTIDPTGTLAPGKTFAIRLNLNSSSGDSLVYDSFDAEADADYIAFTVASDLVEVTAGGIAGLAATPVVYGSAASGFDSSATSIAFTWTTLEQLYSESNYYKLYQKVVGESEWQLAGQFSEISKLVGIYSNSTSGSATVPDFDSATSGQQSPLLSGGSISYMLTAYSKTGLALQSATVSVTDSVAPRMVIGAYADDADWASLTQATTTWTNDTTSPIVITIPVTNTNNEIITGAAVDTSQFTAANSTVSWAYNAARTGVDLTISIPVGASLTAANSVITVSFSDTSGNAGVAAWTTGAAHVVSVSAQ